MCFLLLLLYDFFRNFYYVFFSPSCFTNARSGADRIVVTAARARARAYCAAAGWTSPGTERQFKWIMDIYGPSLGGWVSRCYFAGQSIGRRPRRRGGYFCMRGRHGPRRGFRGLRSRGFGAEYARCKYVNYYAFERVAIIDDRFGF